MAIRFISKATVKNKLPRSSNIWDGTAVYNPYTLVGNYDALATVIVPSGGLSSITFAGIPQTGYSHLQIRILAKTAFTSNSQDGINVQYNNATGSSYNYHYLGGNGSVTYSGGNASATTFMQSISIAGTLSNANMFGAGFIDILDYANPNKYKVQRGFGGHDQNGSGVIELWSGLYMSTDPINTIKLYSYWGSTFVQNSQFALYGVKA